MSKKRDDLKIKFRLLVLVAVYLASRLVNLTALPIFNDEAMYLNWGRLIAHSPVKNWFISLTDGQQPLFIWLMGLAFRLGQDNFLWTGRLVSVVVGLGNLLVFFKIGKELFGRQVGLLMALVYLVMPFSLWYDRLAIKDGLMLFWASFLFYLAMRQVKTNQWWYVLGSGLVLGLSLLTKSIAYFFVGLYPLTVLLLSLEEDKLNRSRALKATVALGLAGLIQSLVYLSPLSSHIGPKHGVFLVPWSELSKMPLSFWRNNLYSTVVWWWQYYRLPVLIMGVLGTGVLLLKKKYWLILLLGGWIFLPISFEILRAKIYIPRYFLFTMLAFTILVALGLKGILERTNKGWVKGVLLGLTLFPSLLLDSQLLFKPQTAPLPQIERWQYFEGWPAGYGLKQLAYKVSQQMGNQPTLVVTEEETLVSSGLSLYLPENDNWQIDRRWPLNQDWGEFPEDLLTDSRQILIVIHHSQSLPSTWPVEKVTQIPRLTGKDYFVIYKLKKE